MINKKRKYNTAEAVNDPDTIDEDRDDMFDNTGMFSGMEAASEDSKGKKRIPVSYETLSNRYKTSDNCPLCERGLFIFGSNDYSRAFATLMKNSVLFISRTEVVRQIKALLDANVAVQQKQFAEGLTTKKPDDEVTEEEIIKHLSEHMTEYTWELRTQIDDQRALINVLKDKIVEVDEAGVESVHEKNVKLFLSAQANLRKIFATEVHKSISFNPELAYNKKEAAQKE
jgi:hypothetical protein